MTGTKGFLGPLGDDFPSIFPIALGLMFFFSSIAVAYDAYNFKDTRSTLMRANVMISRSVRQQAVMTEDYWFDIACPLITDIQANYGVHASLEVLRPHYQKEMDAPSGQVVEDFDALALSKGNKLARCPPGNDYQTWLSDNAIPVNDPSRPTLTMYYPTTVELKWDKTGKYVFCCSPTPTNGCKDVECEEKPAVLAVMTWK